MLNEPNYSTFKGDYTERLLVEGCCYWIVAMKYKEKHFELIQREFKFNTMTLPAKTQQQKIIGGNCIEVIDSNLSGLAFNI